MRILKSLASLFRGQRGSYAPVATRNGDASPHMPRTPPSHSAQGFVNYVTVVIFLEFFSWGLITTILPDAIEEFFGQGRMWLVVGLTQGLKGLLAFLSAPILGALSDAMGRRPFLLLTVISTCLPIPFLFLNNLWFHVIIVALSGAFAVTFSIVFAYVSDVTSESERSAAFGQVSATFAASLVISPALGSVLQLLYGTKLVYALSTIIAVADVLFIIFFVPESLTQHSLEQAEKRRPFSWKIANPLSSLKVVFSSTFMLQWSVIVFFSYLPEAGQYQCLMLYLKNTIGLTETQLAGFIAMVGVLSILSQTSILSFLSKKFKPKTVIMCGLTAQIVQLTLYGLLKAKWQMFAIGFALAFSSISYPSISALLSQTTADEQQGAVQGMVTGIRMLCTGLGPALFGMLFQYTEVALNDPDMQLSIAMSSTAYFPGAPFLVGTASVLIAVFVVMAVTVKQVRRHDPTVVNVSEYLNGSFVNSETKTDNPLDHDVIQAGSEPISALQETSFTNATGLALAAVQPLSDSHHHTA
eukprot:m.164609 g.164609  ORF g.164609 m.164609 type:complete len:527 (+) comp14403_c0_seq1:3098-4678(+)